MQQKITPYLAFTKYKNSDELWKEVENRVVGISELSLKQDLVDFLDSPKAAENFANNFQLGFEQVLKFYI